MTTPHISGRLFAAQLQRISRDAATLAQEAGNVRWNFGEARDAIQFKREMDDALKTIERELSVFAKRIGFKRW